MTRADFAEKLGVNYASVIRWEEGRAIPTKFAQMKFYEYSKERDIPIYQYILNKIENEAASINPEDGRILLYHGAKSEILGDVTLSSREKGDFGKGF